jgi:hypothetical protein
MREKMSERPKQTFLAETTGTFAPLPRICTGYTSGVYTVHRQVTDILEEYGNDHCTISPPAWIAEKRNASPAAA